MPGIAVGIGFFGTNVPSQGSHGAFMYGIGPFVDVYPRPSDGFHVQAGLLYDSISLRLKDLATDCLAVPGSCHEVDYSGSGLGLMAGFGFEGWVGPDWSVGALFRIQYFDATLRPKDSYNPDSAFSLAVPALLFTATNN